VYLLCALTSALCAVLLVRGYRRSGSRLLLWSSLCFIGLAANNALLVVDRLVVTEVDLSTARLLPALAGFAALLYGLVWESE
jgi:hypothetical protein